MNVKTILSDAFPDAAGLWRDYWLSRQYLTEEGTQKKLDSSLCSDVIIFTGNAAHDSTAFSRPPAKAPNPPPAWNAQPATENRHCSLVSTERLLRSRRPAAGQIR